MYLKEIENYKKNLKLTKTQKDVLIGLVLGDGHLETQNKGTTYRLKVEHSIEQKEYVDWLYEIFKEWVGEKPKEKTRGKFKSYGFTTYSHGSLRFYGQQFYLKGIKIIPKIISKLLTPISLAIWFMDDGSWKSNKHKTFIIHTSGYSKQDLKIIQKVLDQKFGIKSSIQTQIGKGLRLYILSKSAENFKKNVEKYVIPSMYYKFGNIMPKE